MVKRATVRVAEAGTEPRLEALAPQPRAFEASLTGARVRTVRVVAVGVLVTAVAAIASSALVDVYNTWHNQTVRAQCVRCCQGTVCLMLSGHSVFDAVRAQCV